MAYTVLASWDFRGSDSAATKRASRIGSYTLTEHGTPGWSSSGVDLSAGTSKLTLALPSELKPSTLWIMGNFRRLSTTDSGDWTEYFGYMYSNPNSSGVWTLAAIDFGTFEGMRFSASGGASDGLYAYSSLSADLDVTMTLGYLGGPAYMFRDGSYEVSGNIGVPPDYSASSYLVLGSNLDITRSNQTRFNWLMIGSGEITSGDESAIRADPNAFLYPVSAPTTLAPGINSGFIF